MRREPTEAESKLWSILRGKRRFGLKFKRQEQLGDYIVDFVCFDARLIVEADGGQHAECAQDAVRDAWLKAQGFRVLRFWNNEILTNLEGVARVILDTAQPPLPNPSPTRGEGL
jgi:very-short-patch-repair endonuclease